MRLVLTTCIVFFASGCSRAAEPPHVQALPPAIPSELVSKCGESAVQLDSLVRANTLELQRTRGIEMEPALFAAMLNHSIPEGERRARCAPAADSLVLTVMQ